MALHGVFVKYENIGIRSLPDINQSVVGVVGTAPKAAGLGKFKTDKPYYLSQLSDLNLADGTSGLGDTGSLPATLAGIFAQGNVGVQMVIVDEPQTADAGWPTLIQSQKNRFLGVGAQTSSSAPTGAPLEAIYAKAKAELKGMYALMAAMPRPKILIAPPIQSALTGGWEEPDRVAPDIPKALTDLASDMRATAIIEGPSNFDKLKDTSTSGFANGLISNIAVPSAYIVGPYVETAAGATVSPSPYVAGAIAVNDFEYDIATSPSNRVLKGIVDTEIPITYFPGLPNSRAQVLNTAKIATIRTDGEIKLWGNELYWQTDGSLKFISVKRTLDHIIDSVVAGMQWAVDKKISARTFELVTQTVNEHLAKMVRQRLILGGQCFPDSRNVKSTLTDGQAFFSLIFTPMYPMREINISVQLTDQFLQPLLDAL